MRINVMTTRPSLPLTLACAPSVSPLMPFAAPVAAPVLGVERAPASRVHQVLVEQAQSVKAGLVQLAAAPAGTEGINGTTGIDGTTGINGTNGNGTNGFLGLGVSGGSARIDSKRSYTDSDGVPPRGRPV